MQLDAICRVRASCLPDISSSHDFRSISPFRLTYFCFLFGGLRVGGGVDHFTVDYRAYEFCPFHRVLSFFFVSFFLFCFENFSVN